MRSETLGRVVYRGEAAKWRGAPTRVEWQEAIAGGPGYRIRKLRYEAVPGFWVPALLYEPEKLEGKVPAVLNFDGRDPDGMFAGYKQVRCINLAKRGMIALNVDWIGMGQLRSPGNAHGLLNHLDLCGTSGVAVFYSLQARGVDVLLAHEHVHPAKVAATGLSGGGWHVIFPGSLDPRVALTTPVAGYSSFLTRSRFGSDLGDSEQTPVDLATVTDYALMTAMLAPRAALLTSNAKDNCCFAADHAPGPLVEAAAPIYRLFGRESNLRTHVNQDPGTHNYLKDNREAFYKTVGDQFFPGQADDSTEEIPPDAEIKTFDQLKVSLSPDQATLHSLAMALGRDLPRDAALPLEKPAASPGRPPAGNSSPRSSATTATRSVPRPSGPSPGTASPPTSGSSTPTPPGPSRPSNSPGGSPRGRRSSSPTPGEGRPEPSSTSWSGRVGGSSRSTSSTSGNRRSPRRPISGTSTSRPSEIGPLA